MERRKRVKGAIVRGRERSDFFFEKESGVKFSSARFVCCWVHMLGLLGGRGARLDSSASSVAVGWVEQREALKWVTCVKRKRETRKR